MGAGRKCGGPSARFKVRSFGPGRLRFAGEPIEGIQNPNSERTLLTAVRKIRLLQELRWRVSRSSAAGSRFWLSQGATAHH